MIARPLSAPGSVTSNFTLTVATSLPCSSLRTSALHPMNLALRDVFMPRMLAKEAE